MAARWRRLRYMIPKMGCSHSVISTMRRIRNHTNFYNVFSMRLPFMKSHAYYWSFHCADFIESYHRCYKKLTLSINHTLPFLKKMQNKLFQGNYPQKYSKKLYHTLESQTWNSQPVHKTGSRKKKKKKAIYLPLVASSRLMKYHFCMPNINRCLRTPYCIQFLGKTYSMRKISFRIAVINEKGGITVMAHKALNPFRNRNFFTPLLALPTKCCHVDSSTVCMIQINTTSLPCVCPVTRRGMLF